MRWGVAPLARLLGGLLCLAAWLKFVQAPDPAGDGVARVVGLAGASIELLVGAALVLRVWPSISVPVAGLLFVLLGAVSLIGVTRGTPRCGCLGDVPVPPWALLIVDAAGAVMLLRDPRRPGQLQSRRPRLSPLDGASLGAFFVGLAIGSSLYPRHDPATPPTVEAIAAARVFTIDSDLLRDQPFPLIPFIRIDADLSRGRWKVILARRGCRRCERMLRTGGCRPDGDERVAVIMAEARPGEGLPGGCDAVLGSLSPGKTWLFASPLTLRLSEGRVTASR